MSSSYFAQQVKTVKMGTAFALIESRMTVQASLSPINLDRLLSDKVSMCFIKLCP